MTINGGKPHAVGDKGQRFELRCKGMTGCDDDEPVAFGWCETLEGAKQMMHGIDLHPTWHTPSVIDRERDVDVTELARADVPPLL